MKEDYLWNKTGDDPEIAGLEEALAVFRYEPGPAPALSRATPDAASPGPAPWAGWFRFAFAASAASVIAASVWLWAAQEREVLTAKNEPAPEVEELEKIPDTAVNAPGTAEPGTADPVPEISAKPRPERIVARRRAPAGNSRNAARPASAALTKEEKYAYDRLMLALSITGSKLKIVRDTIDGRQNESEDNGSEKR